MPPPRGKLRNDIWKEFGVEFTYDDVFQHVYETWLQKVNENSQEQEYTPDNGEASNQAMSHRRPKKDDSKLLQTEKEILRVEEEILRETRETHREVEEIERLLHPHRLTKSVANVFSGDTIMANNVLVFNVGQTSIDTLTPFLTDGVTPSGGVVSSVSVTFSDPSATAVVQPDNTILFTGVADSAGVSVSGSNSFTITDTDGVVSTWNVPFTVQTIGVTPPTQLTQSVANVFSTPTP